MQLTTQQLIIMQYGFRPLIPLADVAKDYLAPSSDCELRRQARQGKLPFAVVINGKVTYQPQAFTDNTPPDEDIPF